MKKLFACVTLLALAMVLAPTAGAAEDGKALFESKCAMCHGKDGVAKPMAKGSKNFNDPAFQKEMTAASISKMIEDGKGKMPASKGKLTPDQISAIAGYVKTIK